MGKAEIKNMSRFEPCPICGKPDYCFWLEIKDNPGMYTLLCRRSSEALGTVIKGNDGKDYTVIPKKSEVIGTFFEEINQREERLQKKISGEKKEYNPIKYTVIDSVPVLPNDKLDEIYRCMLDYLPLYKHHAAYLLKEGWTMQMLKEYRIRSFPAKDVSKLPYSLKGIITRRHLAKKVMKKLGLNSLAGVPGAHLDSHGEWTFNSMSGIVFSVPDDDGYIHRIRIRLDYMDLPVKLKEDKDGFYYMDNGERVTVNMSGAFVQKDGERIYKRFLTHEGKYRNFSSFKKDEKAYKAGFIENTFYKGCEAENQLCFSFKADDDFRVCWFIEGEKKAFYCNYILKQPFISIPGVTSYMKVIKKRNGKTALDTLKMRGVKTAIIAYDADRYSNDMVMQSMNGLAKILKEQGFIVYAADWDIKNGKGLDDLLAAGYLPSLTLIK